MADLPELTTRPQDLPELSSKPPEPVLAEETPYQKFHAEWRNRTGASDAEILEMWDAVRRKGATATIAPTALPELTAKAPDPGVVKVTGRNPNRPFGAEEVIKNPPPASDYAWSYSKSLGRGLYAPVKGLIVDPVRALGSYGYNLVRGAVSGPTPEERATAQASALVDPMPTAPDYYNPIREQAFKARGGKIGPYTEAQWGKLSADEKIQAMLDYAPDLAPFVPRSLDGKLLVASLVLGERPTEKIAGGTPVGQAVSESLQEDPGGTAGTVLTNLWAMNPVRTGAAAATYAGALKTAEKLKLIPKPGVIPGMKTVERVVAQKPDLMQQLAMPWGEEAFMRPSGAMGRPKLVTALEEPEAVAPITAAQSKLADLRKGYEKLKAQADSNTVGGTYVGPTNAELQAAKQAVIDAEKQIADMKTALGPQWENWEKYNDWWSEMGRDVFKRLQPTSAERELSRLRESGIAKFLEHYPEMTTPELAPIANSERLFKVLMEQSLWDKARAQRGLDYMLKVQPEKAFSQLELKLTQAPEIQAARVGREQLWVQYAREHPTPGRTETITVPVPLTTAERVLASGINQYRVGSELVAAARSTMANLSLARHDAIRQGKALLDAEKTWGPSFWKYFTDPAERAAFSELGPHAADPFYQTILSNSKELVRRGLVDESPSFYQNYLTQAHMKLFDVPGWRPEPAVVDRFVDNLRASQAASGKPITIAEAKRVAQDIIEKNKPVNLYLKGERVMLPSGPQAGSLIGRKEMPQWVRDMYGPLPAGPQAYAYTYMEQMKTLLRDNFYRHLESMRVPTTAGPAQVVSDVRLPGFTQIPEGVGFGRLSGKFIADEMVTPLWIIAGESSRAITSKLLDIAKRVWIPANVPTWVRNMEGNLFFSILNDGLPNPTKVNELQAWGNAARDASYYVRTGEMPERVRQVAAAGGITGFQIGEYGDIVNFFHRGVGDLLSSPTPRFDDVMAAHLPHVPAEILKKAAHAGSRGQQAIERVYAAQDLFTRLGNIYTHMARGKSLDEAILGVTKWHPGYDMPSPALALQRGQAIPRGAGLGVSKGWANFGAAFSTPVPSFTHESVRIWEQAIREKPIHAATLMAMPFIHNVTMLALQGEQNPLGAYYDINRNLPDVMQERAYILWPTRNGLHIIDLDPILPGSNLVSSPLQTLTNSPFTSLFSELASNKDAVTGKDIVPPGGNALDIWASRIGQRYTVPPFVTNTARRVELAQETGMGRKFGVSFEEDPLSAAVKEFLGITAIPVENAMAAGAQQTKGKIRDSKRGVKTKTPTLQADREERIQQLENFLEGR